jgi:hypothetical protein
MHFRCQSHVRGNSEPLSIAIVPDPLTPIPTALAAMTDEELAALHIATEETPVTPATSGLLAAIAHCCDWELHRRRGIEFALQDPRAAVGTEDATETYLALAVISAMFETRPRVQALLDAIGDALREAPPTLQ